MYLQKNKLYDIFFYSYHTSLRLIKKQEKSTQTALTATTKKQIPHCVIYMNCWNENEQKTIACIEIKVVFVGVKWTHIYLVYCCILTIVDVFGTCLLLLWVAWSNLLCGLHQTCLCNVFCVLVFAASVEYNITNN